MNRKLYGMECNSDEIETLIEYVFSTAIKLNLESPLCIWGTHGIGKTEIVKEYSLRNNIKFRYISPAQFEEMGDLHGIPEVIEINGNKSTKFISPDWVPKEEGPGILLLDDLNRADDRILRGCMQLIQNYELVSWKLPKGWQIIATANPDDMDYSVTTMDNAMITRMIHSTLIFDVKSWAKWAFSKDLDERGISFVLTYPELINNSLTTPRTLEKLFRLTKPLKDLNSKLRLVNQLATGCIDEYAATAFISFIKDDLQLLIDPEDLLFNLNVETIKKQMKALSVGKNGEVRLDRLSTVCTRLSLYFSNNKVNYKKFKSENLISFLLLDLLPKDLTMSLYKDLIKINNEQLKLILRDKKLADFLLSHL
jgi:hypothetical protein